jgi:hypothetical protein
MNDNRKFIADVKAFADKTADQMLRVAKQSLQDTIRQAQKPTAQGGDMPVDTGFLRNSLVTTVGGVSAGEGSESYVLGLSALQLGDPFQVAWTADYAIARHYMVGTSKGGGLWRDKAAQRWSGFVTSNARKVQ